jgi:NTE family protein
VNPETPSRPEKRLAIVLSGGGARGAYEVGVLSYLFEELGKLRRTPIHVDILCGTSVGAINAAHVAAHLDDPALGLKKLVALWRSLELDQILGLTWKTAFQFFRAGGQAGLVNALPLAELIRGEVPWQGITQNMRAGRLRAISITCTEVYSGRTVLFMQTGPTTSLPTHAPPNTLIKNERIGPSHVLASASLPLIFPPVRVGRELYMDGALRHNTPIAPALRLGASHMFVVSTSREQRGIMPEGPTSPPTTSMIVGKIMNAVLLDHLDNDLAQSRMVNDFIDSGTYAFGDSFLSAHNRAAAERGGRVVHPTRVMVVRPSNPLGAIGSHFLKSQGIRSRSPLTRRLLDWLDPGDQADLPSYILFDGNFAGLLIELGRADAKAQKDRILDFLEELDTPTPEASLSPADWSFPAPAVG